MTCAEKEIDRHFEGTISPASERTMRAHLPACAACRGYYERWLLLSRLDPEALAPEERIGRGLGLRARPSIVPLRLVSAGTALVAAAASVFLWAHAHSDTAGFTPRGGPPREGVSRVFIYDVHPGRPAALAAETITSSDELAFAYENGAAKNRLMIFGVDEHRHVYWFYPAWVAQADDPVAIPIEHDGARHELPEAVRHHFDGARIEIRSLFLDAPVSVSEVEAMIRRDPAAPLPIPGVIDTSAPLIVTAAE